MNTATIAMAIIQLTKLATTLAATLENAEGLTQEQRDEIRQAVRDSDALWQSIPGN